MLRPQPSPEAERVVPARHNDRPDLPQKCIGDGTDRTAASLRQASRPARGAGCAIFQRTGPRRFGAPTFEKSTKSLALQGFWCGAGSAAPMGRLSRRKAVLQHRRNSQRPKESLGGSQRRESTAILETEILCKSSIGVRLTCLPQGLLQAPAPVEIHANAPLKKPKAQPSGRLGDLKAS